jgi:hypothetical protein
MAKGENKMSSKIVPIFSFVSCFIGNQSASGSPLTLVSEMRTGGAQITDETPSDFQQVLGTGKRVQSGNRVATVTLNFIADDILTINLSRGVSILNTMSSAAPANNQYSMLLVAPNTNPTSNYYFPILSAIATRKLDYQKGKPLTTQITFSTETRNVNVVPYFQETLPTLISIMGSRSPF